MNYNELNYFADKAMDYATKISVKYQTLRELDLDIQKNDDLYNKTFSELKELINKENIFYNKESFTTKEIEYLINYIFINYNIDADVSHESLLHKVAYSYLEIIGCRVAFKLENLIQLNEDIPDILIEKDNVNNHIYFQNILRKNYCATLRKISFEKYQNNEISNYLFSYIKYLLPFINDILETEFIENHSRYEDFYFDYQLYGNYFLIHNTVQNQYIYEIFYNTFVEEINVILETSDNEWSEKNIEISKIIVSSLAPFFEKDFLEKMLDDLNSHIEKNYAFFKNYQNATFYLINLKDILKEEKENYKYLSLVPKNIKKS